MSQQLLDTEESAIPDISSLVIEDDTPVDNFQSEKQQRLLTEPLYSSRVLSVPFIAAANVGLFYAIKQDPNDVHPRFYQWADLTCCWLNCWKPFRWEEVEKQLQQ